MKCTRQKMKYSNLPEEDIDRFIAEYKTKESLWNISNDDYSNTIKKYRAYAELSKSFEISLEEVKKTINILHSRFNKMHRKKIEANEDIDSDDDEDDKEESGFYSKLLFLKDECQTTIPKKEAKELETTDPLEVYTHKNEDQHSTTSQSETKSFNTRMMEYSGLPQKHIDKFIEEYKKKECLWNISNDEYSNVIKKYRAYADLAKNFNISLEEVKKAIIICRSSFNRLHRKKIDAIENLDLDDDNDDKDEPDFYKKLIFLKDVYQPKTNETFDNAIAPQKEATDIDQLENTPKILTISKEVVNRLEANNDEKEQTTTSQNDVMEMDQQENTPKLLALSIEAADSLNEVCNEKNEQTSAYEKETKELNQQENALKILKMSKESEIYNEKKEETMETNRQEDALKIETTSIKTVEDRMELYTHANEKSNQNQQSTKAENTTPKIATISIGAGDPTELSQKNEDKNEQQLPLKAQKGIIFLKRESKNLEKSKTTTQNETNSSNTEMKPKVFKIATVTDETKTLGKRVTTDDDKFKESRLLKRSKDNEQLIFDKKKSEINFLKRKAEQSENSTKRFVKIAPSYDPLITHVSVPTINAAFIQPQNIQTQGIQPQVIQLQGIQSQNKQSLEQEQTLETQKEIFKYKVEALKNSFRKPIDDAEALGFFVTAAMRNMPSGDAKACRLQIIKTICEFQLKSLQR